MVKIELILSQNRIIDITNDIINGTLKFFERVDAVFSTGEFELESDYLSTNIAPYTILRKTEDSKVEYYMATSEMTTNFTRNTYSHYFTLLEGTSIFSKYIVGSKAFSNFGVDYSDRYKVSVLKELMNDKYNIDLVLENSYILTQENEFVFSAGTTLYDALTEIAKPYNCRIKVSNIEFVNDKLKIIYKFFNLDGVTFTINNNDIINAIMVQNSDNYCKSLEMEGNNIIEKTTASLATNLFPKSSSVQLNEDTAHIELPVKVEKVSRFGLCNMPATMHTIINVNSAINEATTKKYGTWASIYPDLNVLYDEVFVNYFADKTTFYETLWSSDAGNTILRTYNSSPTYPDKLDNAVVKFVDLNNILSKEKWDLLEDEKKPLYAYYTNGSNLIEGINTYYKDDFWSQLIGTSVKPFINNLDFVLIDTFKDYTYNNTTIIAFEVRYDNFKRQPNLFANAFFATYYPIGNVFIKDEKTDTPTNESSFKNLSLSYNKSGNYIDFDRVTKAMKIENESIGRQEYIITLDTSNVVKPKSSQKITYNNEEFYITNVQTTYNLQQHISIINAVKSYNKLADVIGVESQYNTTKLPFDGIIERPIYCEIDEKVEIDRTNCYLCLYNKDLNIDVIKPVTFFMKNDVVYAYVETIDFYCFDKKTIHIKDKLYKMEDVPYVDEYNKLDKADLYLISLAEELTIDDVLQLPHYKKDYNVITQVDDKIIHKDSREKLTFTFKLKNCIIK